MTASSQTDGRGTFGACDDGLAMNDTFLRAARGEPVDYIPVWFMRQAGRSLPEYRALRERHSILEMCRTPELAAQATLQPVQRLGVDAAILFSDIVVPLETLGVKVEIRSGVGPVIGAPVRSPADVEKLGVIDDDGIPYVTAAVRHCVDALDVPLIGFAGAPFTLACYLVEGGPSKDHARTKALMHTDPKLWNALMNKLTDATVAHLAAQVRAGASALQVFDSWIGFLTPSDLQAHVLPWLEEIFLRLAPLEVPRTLFGVGTGELLSWMARTDTEVIGVDWRVPLDAARARVGAERTLQGNLDPAAVLAPWEVLEEQAGDVLRRGGGHRHVFNLGHGVLPASDPAQLQRLVDFVHGWRPDE